MGLILDVHDVVYNKLWAGRTKDIAYVSALLHAGVLDLENLRALHVVNTLMTEDRARVGASLARLVAV